MENFTLLLDGDAFLIYSGMSADNRKKENEAKKFMEASFSMTSAAAY